MTITERKAHDKALADAIAILREAAVTVSDISTSVWTIADAREHS